MVGKPYTSDTAWREHKRGGKMVFSDKQLSFLYLNFCERMTWKSRGAIMKEYQRNWLRTYSEEDLEIYIRDRVEHIVEKTESIIKKEEVRAEIKPKVSMEDIMKKIAEKPAPIVTTNPVYVRPVDPNYKPPEDIGAWVRVYDPDQQ